jgi:UDP-glucuronate decarboxylase
VEALLRLTFANIAKGEVINVGNDEEITVVHLAEIIKKLTNSTSEITFGPLPQDDPLRRCPDISKAKQILEWRPKVKLEEGLKKTIVSFIRLSALDLSKGLATA